MGNVCGNDYVKQPKGLRFLSNVEKNKADCIEIEKKYYATGPEAVVKYTKDTAVDCLELSDIVVYLAADAKEKEACLISLRPNGSKMARLFT